jgi:hypothetical protein
MQRLRWYIMDIKFSITPFFLQKDLCCNSTHLVPPLKVFNLTDCSFTILSEAHNNSNADDRHDSKNLQFMTSCLPSQILFQGENYYMHCDAQAKST